MILLIDHFDSFTYNIVQAYQRLGQSVEVVRSHAYSHADLLKKKPHLIILGPGPGSPSHFPFSKELLALGQQEIPIFGICLGHQLIGESFGGIIHRAQKPLHGKTSPIFHQNQGVFSGLSQGFLAARYHSLIIDAAALPEVLHITAWSPEQEIMGIAHKTLPIQGVQFHPESIATEEGLTLLQNSLSCSTQCI